MSRDKREVDMNEVWIVQNRLKPEEIEVFDNEAASLNHRKNATNKWKLTQMFIREVKSI
jgi:hypothetical protein